MENDKSKFKKLFQRRQSTQSPTPYTIYFVVFTKIKYGWGWERPGYPRKSAANKRGIK